MYICRAKQTISTKTPNDHDTMEWKELMKALGSDPEFEANRELASLVVANQPRAVHYYLTDIGMPIVRYIETNITHCDVLSDYYIFLSSPFDDQRGEACWHRVDLYRGANCRLSTYTSSITCRHFCKEANKEKKRKMAEGELLDFVDYESLLECDSADEEGESLQQQCVRKAFEQLSERHRQALRCLVIEKKSGLEAFDTLSPYITPRPKDGMSSDEVKAAWTDKQRQDAMSLLKGRALVQLQHLFNQIKKQY
jgi:hypothetical protein